MAIIKKSELKQMSDAERKAKIQELKSELLRLQTQKITKKSIEKPGRVKAIRRTLARVLTLEHQKEMRAVSTRVQP